MQRETTRDPSLKHMKYLLSSSRMSRDFPARHLSIFSGDNSHCSFIKLSQSLCLLFVVEGGRDAAAPGCFLKDSVKGVLTVAPAGESLPRHFSYTSGRNNVSGLNRRDGSHPPVASVEIFFPLFVPLGWLVELGGVNRRWNVNMDVFLFFNTLYFLML